MIIINEEIKIMKDKCHEVFDAYWKSYIVTLKNSKTKQQQSRIRKHAYHRLAGAMRTDAHQCHFRNMNDLETLQKAYNIITSWDYWK